MSDAPAVSWHCAVLGRGRAGTHRRPAWRKRGRHEGFRIVGAQALRVERVNHRWSRVLIPQVGWVPLRRSRDVPDATSYRVTLDGAGRWHLASAVNLDTHPLRSRSGNPRPSRARRMSHDVELAVLGAEHERLPLRRREDQRLGVHGVLGAAHRHVAVLHERDLQMWPLQFL